MNNTFLPPPVWFDTAIEIIGFARGRKKKDDFIVDAKLRPQIVGQSYSYRIDVMEQLIRNDIVQIQDDRLLISSSLDIDWLDNALLSGYSKAWEFASALGYDKEVDRKFNADVLKQIGDTGETFVLSELYSYHSVELHPQIKHVAAHDDTLGYDIRSPSTANSDTLALMEVKTSIRRISDTFEFYLSRNEFEVGKSNRDWSIVAVSIVDDKPIILGHLYCYQIESRLPKDMDKGAKWASCKLIVEMDLFRPGLP